MVKGATILMKGFQIGTLYKLLGSVKLNGYNIVSKFNSTETQLNLVNSNQLYYSLSSLPNNVMAPKDGKHWEKRTLRYEQKKVWSKKVFMIVI
jgi:hypothetical protein